MDYTFHRFVPSFKTIGAVQALPLQRVLSKEQMFYQASMEFAHEKGGPIVREFVEKLPFKEGDNVLVDVRVHSLQAGYYPAIPGWHLDWLPRKNNGADPIVHTIPDYDHVVLIIAETSLTEFVDMPMWMGLRDTGAFEEANEIINGRYNHDLKTQHVLSGDMVQFTSRDWHRPVPAEGNEWRFLARASRVDHKEPVNRLVNQAQVYIPIKEASW